MAGSRAAHTQDGEQTSRARLWLILLMVVTGCGYQLSGRPGMVPGALRSISVPIFANGTAVPGLEHLLTTAVRQQLQRDGRVRLGTEATATARLRGEVTRHEVQVLATNPNDFVLEYRIETGLRLTLEDRQQGAVLLQQALAITTDYVVTERVVSTDIARERALHAAARDAGERVVSLLLDRF
jgi:outer membrane lipopolysaccharide assembly protein LptE/RlpB